MTMLTRVVRALTHAPDRILHRRRQRVALARIDAGALPTSLLIVCQGNVCRSPYAALRLQHELARVSRNARVASAGLVDPGRRPPNNAVLAAAELGAELSLHRSRLVNRSMLVDADLVVVMSPAQRDVLAIRHPEVRSKTVVLGDLDPDPILQREIVDPIGQSLVTFEGCYRRIDRCLDLLVRRFVREGPPSTS